MQKWEYDYVLGEKIFPQNLVPRESHERESYETAIQPKIKSFLNGKGEEGWDLVSFHAEQKPSGGTIVSHQSNCYAEITAVFKRPK